MKKSKAGIFTLSSSSLIVCESLVTIIIIFLDTFLVSKLMKLTPGDYTGISLFNFLYYVIISLSTFVITPLFKKMSKSLAVSIGALFLAGLFIFVYMLGDNIVSYIWLLGCLSGLGTGINNAGFNNLLSDTISSKHQTIYFSVKNIIIFMIKTVFPLVLGVIIDFGSFALMCVLNALICIFIFVFSFLVKNKKTTPKSFNIIKFWRIVKQGKEETKPIKTLFLSAFFRGFCFDLIATIFTILLFFVSNGSDFKIGLFQTIFTALQLVSMFLFMKFYHKNRAKWFVFGSLGLILLSSIPVFISINLTSVLIFFGVYYFFRLFITTITDMRKPVLIRLLSMHSHSLEYNATYSLIYGISRGSSYLLLLISLAVSEVTMVYIVLGVNLLAYILYATTLYVLEKQLIAQDIRWKKEHQAELNIANESNKEIKEDVSSEIPVTIEQIKIKEA